MLAMDQFKDIARLRALRVAPARRHGRRDRAPGWRRASTRRWAACSAASWDRGGCGCDGVRPGAASRATALSRMRPFRGRDPAPACAGSPSGGRRAGACSRCSARRRAPPNPAGSTGCRARCRARRTRRSASSGCRTRSTARGRDRPRDRSRARPSCRRALAAASACLCAARSDVATIAMSRASQNACGGRATGSSSDASSGMTGCASGGLGNFGATGTRPAASRDETTTTATAAATATPMTPAPMMLRGLRPAMPLPPCPTCTGESIGRARDRLDPALHYARDSVRPRRLRCPSATDPGP